MKNISEMQALPGHAIAPTHPDKPPECGRDNRRPEYETYNLRRKEGAFK
tara:strand:+ start:11711 stop:11857 length:147 start_codon:yes stop_codon:yes gene_type:complete